MLYDAKEPRFETIRVAWDPENPLSGREPTIVDLSGHAPAHLTVPAGTD
jgi:adenylyltransferase/sulfurtransferase